MRKLLVLFLVWNLQLSAGWLDRKAEGWAWYEEEEQPQQAEEIAIEEEPKASALEQIDIAKKRLESLFAEALINPSQENLVNYMEAQKEWIGKAADFSNRWGKALLSRPDLDPTATTFATTHYGRQLQKAIEQEEKTKLIQAVAQEYGLFFFYEGQNKTSQAFAQVVKAFADKYHWTVIGISTDGTPLPEIPSEAESSLAEKFGINIFPALLAFEAQTQKAVPLAFGLKSLDQIENNIFMQLKNTAD